MTRSHLLLSVIVLVLVCPSFSFPPDDPNSDEHVTSVSVSVRRITKTKGNISVRINRKRETLKLKIKRRASRRLLQNYGPNTLLNNTRLNFDDPEFDELTKNKTNCRESVQEQNRREPFPDFNNRSKAATPEQLGIWDWSQAFASEGNEKLQMEPKISNAKTQEMTNTAGESRGPIQSTATQSSTTFANPRNFAEENYIKMRKLKFKPREDRSSSTTERTTMMTKKTSKSTLSTVKETTSSVTVSVFSSTLATSTSTKTSRTSTTLTTSTKSSTSASVSTTQAIFKTSSSTSTTHTTEKDSIVTTTLTEPTIITTENYEKMIQGKIVKVKSDLSLLLNFNENLLHFGGSIMNKAAETKVKNFLNGISQLIASPDGKSSKENELNAASQILNATEDISDILASTLSVGSKTDIKMTNITMTVMKKIQGKNTSSLWETEKVKVNLPDQQDIAESDSTITTSFTSFDNLGNMMNVNENINGPVLSVHIVKKDIKKRSVTLSKPISFSIHHEPLSAFHTPKCVYWNFREKIWSEDGCFEIAIKRTATTTHCECHHLTNFALSVVKEVPTTTVTSGTVDSNKWDALEHFSAEPSITINPDYFDETLNEGNYNFVTPSTKSPSVYTDFIVSSQPRILRLQSSTESTTKQDNTTSIVEKRERLKNRELFNEFHETPEENGYTTKPDASYEDFWDGEPLNSVENVGRRDNREDELYSEYEKSSQWVFINSFIDLESKNQPLRLEKLERKEIEINEANIEVSISEDSQKDQAWIKIAGSTSATLLLLMFLFGIGAFLCWLRVKSRKGKFLLRRASSSIGSVSSLRSLYSKDHSSSCERLSLDNFLKSLEEA